MQWLHTALQSALTTQFCSLTLTSLSKLSVVTMVGQIASSQGDIDAQWPEPIRLTKSVSFSSFTHHLSLPISCYLGYLTDCTPTGAITLFFRSLFVWNSMEASSVVFIETIEAELFNTNFIFFDLQEENKKGHRTTTKKATSTSSYQICLPRHSPLSEKNQFPCFQKKYWFKYKRISLWLEENISLYFP